MACGSSNANMLFILTCGSDACGTIFRHTEEEGIAKALKSPIHMLSVPKKTNKLAAEHQLSHKASEPSNLQLKKFRRVRLLTSWSVHYITFSAFWNLENCRRCEMNVSDQKVICAECPNWGCHHDGHGHDGTAESIGCGAIVYPDLQHFIGEMQPL